MISEIADGIFDITCGEVYGLRFRSYLIDDEIPTLIDTTWKQLVDGLIDGIEESEISPERLVITHGDDDHTDSIDIIAEEYDVEIWVPKESNLGQTSIPDNIYSEGSEIGKFEAVHIPGHTSDSYALIDSTNGILIAGDILVGSDLRGLPPGYVVLPPFQTSENLNEAEENLFKLLEFDFEIALVFHGTSVLEDARGKLERFLKIPRTPY